MIVVVVVVAAVVVVVVRLFYQQIMLFAHVRYKVYCTRYDNYYFLLFLLASY